MVQLLGSGDSVFGQVLDLRYFFSSEIPIVECLAQSQMYAMWEGVQGLNEEYPMLLLWGSPPL